MFDGFHLNGIVTSPMKEFKHETSGKIVELNKEAFFALFDESIHANMERLFTTYPTAQGLVCFENLDMSSSHMGERTACPIGPDNTITFDNLNKARLGAVPSVAQYPRYIWIK